MPDTLKYFVIKNQEKVPILGRNPIMSPKIFEVINKYGFVDSSWLRRETAESRRDWLNFVEE